MRHSGNDILHNLANATIKQAVVDYEQALCHPGEMSSRTITEIEKFAENGAEVFTELDFAAILRRIKAAHREFNDLVSRELKTIHAERKSKKKTIRCPLCGGALYTRVNRDLRGYLTVACTGCDLTKEVRLDEAESE